MKTAKEWSKETFHFKSDVILRDKIQEVQLDAMKEGVQLAKEVIALDQERLRAQMSGLETGWEHPNTQTYFKRVKFLADAILTAAA